MAYLTIAAMEKNAFDPRQTNTIWRWAELACCQKQHQADGADCEKDPNRNPILRYPNVCLKILFHASPSQQQSLAPAVPQSHDSAMKNQAEPEFGQPVRRGAYAGW